MVAPVLAKTSDIRLKTMTRGVNGWFERIWYAELRYGYTQVKPYNIDTPLTYIRQWSVGNSFSNLDGIHYSAMMLENQVVAENKARAKFVSELGDASQIGSTMTAELKATWGTVAGGVTTALRAARSVAKGDLLEAGKLLGFHPPVKQVKRVYTSKSKKRRQKRIRTYTEYWAMPDGRMVAKSLSNKWLWYSYGVRPLVDDLYNASRVFTREIPGTKVVGRGYAETKTSPSISIHHYKCNSKVQGYVRVINPNLWLANQLGLINPIQWFNEGIAFSFVIDWFSNWSDWLRQLTDFAGLEIVNPSTFSMNRTHRIWRNPGDPFFGSFDEHYVYATRVLKIPPVRLRFAYERFQWQRGANAVSLLVQFLRDKK